MYGGGGGRLYTYRYTVTTRMTSSVKKQNKTKNFFYTRFVRTKIRHANFRGNPLCWTLKQQLNGEKRRKLRWRAKPRICFWLSYAVLLGRMLKTLTTVTSIITHTRHNWDTVMMLGIHAATKFELAQYTALKNKVTGFKTTLGVGHILVSAQHTFTMLSRNYYFFFLFLFTFKPNTKQICRVPVKIR